MSILTNLTNSQIDGFETELDGKVLTRPTLLVSDGISIIHAVDVDIGKEKILRNVPIARANRDLLYAEVGAAVRLRRTSNGRYEITGFSKEQPGTTFRIPITIPDFLIGDPSGGLDGPIVIGGEPLVIIGTPVDLTLTGRPLTYGEIETLGNGYGVTAYGSTGIFLGGVLQEITA